MRFENANSPASVCSPTRYAMLTGRYAWRGQIQFGVVSVMDPLVIDPDRMTMGKYFQEMGYRTAQIGKWHLGYGSKKPVDFTAKLTPGPNDVGFDYHFGLPQNLDDLLRVWIENDGIHGLRSKKLSPYGKSFYGSQYAGFDAPQRSREEAGDVLTGKAVEWIKSEHRADPDTPFFLYFASPATHHPIVPSEEMRGASGCGAYGDFIQDLDRSFGTIVEALEYEGIAGKTPSPKDAPDSISFLPSLLGVEQESRAPMITTSVAGVAALRDGRWKYIEGEFPEGTPEGMRRGNRSEAKRALYDLESDVGEENNVLSTKPELAQQMQKTLDQYREMGATRLTGER